MMEAAMSRGRSEGAWVSSGIAGGVVVPDGGEGEGAIFWVGSLGLEYGERVGFERVVVARAWRGCGCYERSSRQRPHFVTAS